MKKKRNGYVANPIVHREVNIARFLMIKESLIGQR